MRRAGSAILRRFIFNARHTFVALGPAGAMRGAGIRADEDAEALLRRNLWRLRRGRRHHRAVNRDQESRRCHHDDSGWLLDRFGEGIRVRTRREDFRPAARRWHGRVQPESTRTSQRILHRCHRERSSRRSLLGLPIRSSYGTRQCFSATSNGKLIKRDGTLSGHGSSGMSFRRGLLSRPPRRPKAPAMTPPILDGRLRADEGSCRGP